MGTTCGVAGLSAAVARIKREYGEDVKQELQDDLIYAGEYCAGELARTSPSRPGRGGKKYRTGWDYRFKAKGGNLTVEVGNTTKPSLTHLLEKGHMTRNHGGWVSAREHIEPAFEKTVEMLDRRLHG